jgi:OOP family OmpA-OmpF porin
VPRSIGVNIIFPGFRDPLAADPTALMKQANINPKAVISKWKPYLSLDSQFVVARAKQLLKPPETVSLKIDENGILYAIGSAPRQWIGETRKMVQFIPGITKYQEENLVDTESAKLLSAKAEIEKEVILFEEGTTQLIAGEEQKLQKLIQAIKNITNTARVLDKAVSIEILGHSNTGGSEQRNIILSSERARAIASIFASRGIETLNLKNIAVGSSQPLANSSTDPIKH